MFAVSSSPILSTVTSLSPASTVGYLLLVASAIALLFSSHRYLVLYLLGGMFYGLIIKIIQSGLVHTFAVSYWNGYIIALAFTWLIGAWLIYRRQLSEQFGKPFANAQSNQHTEEYYIEHTPIYTNYRPRFPN